MKVAAIAADSGEIIFTLDTPVEARRVRVSLFSPALAEERELCSVTVTVNGTRFSIPRRLAGRDGLTLCYTLSDETGDIEGVHYVGEILSPRYSDPYPAVRSKKGLHVEDVADACALGVAHAVLSANLGDLLMEYPAGGDTIFYRHDGREFYLRRSVVEALDAQIQPLTAAGVAVTLILLNAPVWQTEVNPRFWRKICHPDGENAEGGALFDVMREEGCAYFCAFVSFLAERYARADAAHGRIVGMIVGSAANSSASWMYAGETPIGDFAAQLTTALRLTWQCAAAVWQNLRVYVSLDRFWASCSEENEPGHSYPGRELLALTAHCCALEGDFPWNVAIQAYPDGGEVDHSLDAPTVTVDNPEVLRDFLALPEYLYCGASRRILLSEQGFSSGKTAEGEAMQAEQITRAYRLAEAISEIDGFFYYAHIDHAEDGAPLGLRRADGSEKLSYAVFAQLDR